MEKIWRLILEEIRLDVLDTQFVLIFMAASWIMFVIKTLLVRDIVGSVFVRADTKLLLKCKLNNSNKILRFFSDEQDVAAGFDKKTVIWAFFQLYTADAYPLLKNICWLFATGVETTYDRMCRKLWIIRVPSGIVPKKWSKYSIKTFWSAFVVANWLKIGLKIGTFSINSYVPVHIIVLAFR